MSDYYTATGSPATSSSLSSSAIRGEFTAISAAFDKLPSLTTNANQVWYTNTGGTAATSSSGLTFNGTTLTANALSVTNNSTFNGNVTLGDTNADTLIANSSLTVKGGTVTVSAPALNLSQAFNNVSTNFNAIFLNVNNITSGAGSSLIDLQVSGNSMLKVSMAGLLTAKGGITVTAGGLTVTSGNVDFASGTLHVSSYINAGGSGQSAHYFVSGNAGVNALRAEHTNADPVGGVIYYSAAAPNSTGSLFLACIDNVGTKAELRSNGGLANFSANDVNLSTRKVKNAYRGYTDAELLKFEAFLEEVDFGVWKYKDQTHNDWNHGPTVEGLEIALRKYGLTDEESSLIDIFDPVRGLKGIITHDFNNITMASLVASNKRLRERIQKLENI